LRKVHPAASDTRASNNPGLKLYDPFLESKLPTTGLTLAVLLALAVFFFPISGLCLPDSVPSVKEKSKTDAPVLSGQSEDTGILSTEQDSGETTTGARDSAAGREFEFSPQYSRGVDISWISVFSWIFIVIGLLLLFLYLLRRFLFRPMGVISSGGQFEMLQQFHLGPRKSICLVKVYDRLFLLGVTESSVTRLSEIDNPEEVAKILAQLKASPKMQGKPFREVYQDLVGRFKK